MITSLPDFVEGIDWRELPPAEGKRRYRFQTLREITVRLDAPLHEIVAFRDRTGRVRARFDGPLFTVLPAYAWNGNSPKRWVPLLGWIGTPDCRGDVTGLGGNILASLVHDAMRQFCRTQHFPFSLAEADVCFYDINRLSGFLLAMPYYSAVRAASGVWPHIDNGEHSILPKP